MDYTQKTDKELLDIWVKNDRDEYSGKTFIVIHDILQERGVVTPLQVTVGVIFFGEYFLKFFLKFLVILMLIFIILANTNPPRSSYVSWAKDKIMEKSTSGLETGLVSLFGNLMIDTTTTSKDLYFATVFTTIIGDNKVTTLGMFNQFIIISGK